MLNLFLWRKNGCYWIFITIDWILLYFILFLGSEYLTDVGCKFLFKLVKRDVISAILRHRRLPSCVDMGSSLWGLSLTSNIIGVLAIRDTYFDERLHFNWVGILKFVTPRHFGIGSSCRNFKFFFHPGCVSCWGLIIVCECMKVFMFANFIKDFVNFAWIFFFS